MNKDTKKGTVFLLTAAFIYSTMPVLVRILGVGGIPPISQVFLRYIFAFLSAGIYYFYVVKAKFFFPKKDFALLMLAAIVGYGLTNLFFTIGILNTEVSNALFLFYSFAIIAPILGFIFLRDKLNIFNAIALVLSLIALLFLFYPNSIPTWKIGGFFAMLAALAQAIYLISRKRLESYTASYMMLANTFLGVLSLGILSLIFEQNFYVQGAIKHLLLSTWMITILFGILNFLAWIFMTKGFEYFKASSASIILLSELIFGVMFAFLFFKEIPTYVTIVGGGLIALASVLVILKGEN